MLRTVPIGFLLTVLASGCQLTPLGLACTKSESNIAFPEQGAMAQIDVAFRIHTDTETLEIRERGICEYQGAMCPAGDWFLVWYAIDDAIRYEYELDDGERLTVWPHGLCISLDEFRRNCRNGSCTPEEHFDFRLELSEERARKRTEECAGGPGVTSDPDHFLKCAMPEVQLVNFSQLQELGYKIENGSITISEL